MQEESVKGIVDHIIYRNDENGYTVLSLHTDGKKLTLVGFFQVIRQSMPPTVTSLKWFDMK